MGLGTSSPASAAGTAGPASLAQSWAAWIQAGSSFMAQQKGNRARFQRAEKIKTSGRSLGGFWQSLAALGAQRWRRDWPLLVASLGILTDLGSRRRCLGSSPCRWHMKQQEKLPFPCSPVLFCARRELVGAALAHGLPPAADRWVCSSLRVPEVLLPGSASRLLLTCIC